MLVKIFLTFFVVFMLLWGAGHFLTPQLIKENAWFIVKVAITCALAIGVIVCLVLFL